MKAVIPKITQGSGSLIEIHLLINADPRISFTNYTGYAIYDQGSASASFVPSSGFAREFESNPWLFIGLIVAYAYAIPYSLILMWIMNKRRLRKLIDGLLGVRINLKDDSKNSLPDVTLLLNKMTTRKLIYEIPDYLLIQDLYDLLKKREDLIKKGDLSNLNNKDCLNSLDSVLQKIDWKKYEKAVYRHIFLPVKKKQS